MHLQIDGKNNPKIQNVFLDNFPVMSAEFSKNGEEVVMGSKHRSFYYYDMIAGQVVFVPKIKGTVLFKIWQPFALRNSGKTMTPTPTSKKREKEKDQMMKQKQVNNE